MHIQQPTGSNKVNWFMGLTVLGQQYPVKKINSTTNRLNCEVKRFGMIHNIQLYIFKCIEIR